jgi:hypothetical protein
MAAIPKTRCMHDNAVAYREDVAPAAVVCLQGKNIEEDSVIGY